MERASAVTAQEGLAVARCESVWWQGLDEKEKAHACWARLSVDDRFRRRRRRGGGGGRRRWVHVGEAGTEGNLDAGREGGREGEKPECDTEGRGRT